MAVDHSPEFFDRRVFSLEVRLDGTGRLERVEYTGGSIDGTDEE